MTDISKLKAEAEEARNEAIDYLSYEINHKVAASVADALIAATIKQIALQAAEKEAKSTLVAQFNQAVINAQAIDEANYDGTWIQHGGNGCPIPYARYVQIKRRDGKVESNTASMFYWEWSGKKLAENDPIAYRIITPAADRIEE